MTLEPESPRGPRRPWWNHLSVANFTKDAVRLNRHPAAAVISFPEVSQFWRSPTLIVQ